MATMGSARLLGRQDEIGSLEVGKAADLFLLNADLLELAGAKLDPACMLGTVGYARPAELVMVNGRVVVEHGRVLGMDEEQTRVRPSSWWTGCCKKRNKHETTGYGAPYPVVGYMCSIRATAWADMPEPSPVKPRCSSVVALTLTQPGPMARAAARFSCICRRWADLRGLGDEGGVDVHHPVSGVCQGVPDPGQQHQAGDV